MQLHFYISNTRFVTGIIYWEENKKTPFSFQVQ